MNEHRAEKLYNGVTQVGDDLIAEAGVVQLPKRKKTASWRWGVVAACLCLALVGTAAAVQFFGVQVLDWHEEGKSGVWFAGGITYYPMSVLSDEVKALEGKQHFKSFGSWQAAEDFIGVDLMNNPVLEASPATSYHVKFIDGNDSAEGRFVITISKALDHVRVYGCYEMGEVNIDVQGFLFTEQGKKAVEELDEQFLGYSFTEETELSREFYTTPSGLETQIIGIDCAEGHRDTYMAALSINGVPFVIRARCDENPEAAREALLQILDGFQV